MRITPTPLLWKSDDLAGAAAELKAAIRAALPDEATCKMSRRRTHERDIEKSKSISIDGSTRRPAATGYALLCPLYLPIEEKNRVLPLGSDLRDARDKLGRLKAQIIDMHDFDLDRERASQTPPRDGKACPFMFDEWSEKFPTFDDVKRKRSLRDDLRMSRLHLKPFFGSVPLTDMGREALCRYVDNRSAETLVRGKNGSSKKVVSRGTISNELSLLRRMLSVGRREGYQTPNPSFEDLIIRVDKKPRALSLDEQKIVLGVYSPWMAWLAEFAGERASVRVICCA